MPLHRPSLFICSFLAVGIPVLAVSTADPTTATRLVGTLGLSREAPNAVFAGLLRVDGLITNSDSNGDELSSNRVALNYKFDTPSRDISADLTDPSSVAADTGASVTQDSNVARERWVLSPNWRYNLTRLTTLETDLTFTSVTHELPSAREALRTQWALNPANDGVPPPDPISIDDTGFFTVLDELDDFQEAGIDIGIKSKLSPISTISFFAGYSDFTANVEPDSSIIIPFEQTDPAPDNKDIRRKRKRERRSNTTKFRVGYDRAFTPTLNIGIQAGIYTNETDDTNLLRLTESKSSGYLANITATKSTGVTKYSAKFGVDVLPSDTGSQVESLEAVGDLFRQIGPLLDFSFRVRAYEPDALKADADEEFSRRFLSLEPKLIWRFSRAWTVAGSYRYRRQKSQAADRSGESNALLFSLKYTPPSAIRDAQLNDG